MKTEKETAEVFNKFFGNAVKNINISQYSDLYPIIEKVKDPTLKANLKYGKHRIILAIRTKCNRNGAFLVLRRSILRKLKQKLGFETE